MRNIFCFLIILSLFSLLGMFSAAFAARVYVMGSPTVLPTSNNTLPVEIRVENRSTDGYVLLALETTSAMNGQCTNSPLNSNDTSADLVLLKSDNTGSEWSDLGTGVLKYKMPYSSTDTTHDFTVYVRSRDYGAWGTLRATLYKKTGTDANGNDVFVKDSSKIGTVPRDENGNHIADGWKNDFFPYKDKNGSTVLNPKEVHYNNTKKSGVKNYPYSVPFLAKRQNTVDKETGPNNNKENGDGFTAFEEYRGFMTTQYATAYGYASAGHTRTDPGTKDVFYVIRNSMSSYGIGDAKTHHPFLFTEMHERCVNKPFTAVWNATHTGYDSDVTNEYGWINTNSDGIPNWEYVHAIRIEAPQDYLNSTTNVLENKHPDQPDDYMGLAAGTNKPYAYSLINIYVDAITAEKQNNTDFANVSVSDLVANVISHEVGHMVNLDHCSTTCLQNHPNGCLMDPYTSKYMLFSPTVEHEVDYDLAGSVKDPEQEDGSGRKTVAPPNDGTPSEPSRSLISSNGSYTAVAGNSHTANFSTGSVYSSVYWYVKTPSDTSSLGTTIEIDQGDGSLTTASFTYTFPSDVSGDYKITAYVYDSSSSVYEESYTVTVSSSTTPATPTYSLVSSDGSYTATVGDSHIANFSTSSPYSMVYWYVKTPSDTDYYGFNQQIDYGDGSKTTASYTYQFASAGYYKFTAYVYSGSGSVYETSYWVSISLPGTPNTGNNGNSGGSSTTTVTIAPGTGYTSTATVGSSYTLTVNVSEPMSQVKWYWQRPGYEDSLWTTNNYYDGTTTSDVTYVSFDGTNPTENVGMHEFRVEVTLTSGEVHHASYTVTVEE